MGYSLPLFLGFLTASFGITPPGLINMTAAKVSISEGRTQAMIFAFGATIVVLVQTFIGVIFARFIDENPYVVILLREAGLFIFALLTIYFFFFAKKSKTEKEEPRLHSKKSRFFLGMLLSALNFFPIPFYVFISVTLASYHYFVFELPFIYTFVMGSGLGAFFGFYCYIAFFKKLESRTTFIIDNMNYIVGSITGLISVITLVNVVLYYIS
jgi:threonine/homoserine/homoserine lactone efflux protein